MAEPHSHELDGKLHEGCAMCDLIRQRQVGAKIDIATERALEAHQRTAEKSRRGRDELLRQEKAAKRK